MQLTNASIDWLSLAIPAYVKPSELPAMEK